MYAYVFFTVSNAISSNVKDTVIYVYVTIFLKKKERKRKSHEILLNINNEFNWHYTF